MYWGGVEKHVCMLHEQAGGDGGNARAQPPAGRLRRLAHRLRPLLLACAGHHGAALFLRSQKELRNEQQRQIASGYWMVCHPYSPLRFYWACFFLVVSSVAFLYMPMQVFYTCPCPYNPLILFSDGVAFFEIFVNFMTGCGDEDGKRVILEPKEIARRYVTGGFVVDLVGALPLQLIQPFERCEYPSHTVMFLFKLFRLRSMQLAWTSVHEQLEIAYTKLMVISVLIRLLIFFHWATYCHYQVPALCAHFYPMDNKMENWLRRYRVVSEAESPLMHKYVRNLYYVAGLCIGAGVYSPVHDHLLPELLLTAAMGIFGLLFITYSLTTVLCLTVYKHFESYLYNGRMKELQDYMVLKRLPHSLQQKIQLYINYKFNGHYFDEQSILNTVNEQIKQDINMFYCKRLVINVPLFQDMPVALINSIIFSLTQVLYMPGEVIVEYGKPGSSLYLIASGTVAVMNAEGKEVAHLKDSAFFGERALLSPGTRRSATIVALEITEIYKLNNQQFQACLQPCPRLKRRLEEVARQRSARSLRGAGGMGGAGAAGA